MRAFQRAGDVTSTSFVRSFTGTISVDDQRIRNGGVPSTLHRQWVNDRDRFPSTKCGGFGIRDDPRRMLSSGTPQFFEGLWHEKYLLLEQYKKENGNCLVPESFVLGDVKLGQWVKNQRAMYRNGNLSQNRREMLDALGFSWDPKGDKWERNFALLKHYKEREGHCNVPYSYEEEGIKLGSWLNTQRVALKREKLDESYQRRLEALGVVWDLFGDQWDRTFALLEQFKYCEGHCNVPDRHEENSIKLGAWLGLQRTAMRRGKLDESRKRRLDDLGVIWDPIADEWERNFALLEQFKKREGHCNVPHSHEEDGVKLGMWLDRLRQVKKGNASGNLSLEQIERLEALGVSWGVFEDQWERKFALLEQFKEREGHCNVPQSHEEEGVKLGLWLHNLRQVRRENTCRGGNLSMEQIERLDKLGMRW